MTDKAVKSLQLARNAIMKNEIMEAKSYYSIVLQESPNNLEAEWFYRFGMVLGEITAEIADHYVRLADIFYPMLEHLATYEEGELKHHLVQCVVVGFPPVHDSLNIAMIQSMARGNTSITMDDVVKVDMVRRVDKETLPDKILELFGDEAPYCFMAVRFWKERIAERFKRSQYRNFQDRGKELWFDELAKRIKLYDPSYEMPQFKQAGCIAFGDAAKVAPESK